MLRCCAVPTLLLGKRCPNTCFRETLEPTPGALEGVSLHMWCEFDLKVERYNKQSVSNESLFRGGTLSQRECVGRVIKCTQQLYCKWRSSANARRVGKCHVATQLALKKIADAKNLAQAQNQNQASRLRAHERIEEVRHTNVETLCKLCRRCRWLVTASVEQHMRGDSLDRS